MASRPKTSLWAPLPRVKCRRLKKSQGLALLANGNWTLDPENCEAYLWDAYVSDRGELLLIDTCLFDKTARLYESRKALMDSNAALMARSSQHILEGLLPEGEHFIEAVPALIDKLAVFLRLPRESLDGTSSSLRLVDAALKKVRPRKRILETEDFFAAIVAYTGEVMRREVHGVWWLHAAEEGVHEPYILLAEGQLEPRLDPFSAPLQILAGMIPGGLSLAAVVSAELSSAAATRARREE